MRKDETTPIDRADEPVDFMPNPALDRESTPPLDENDAVPSDADLEKWHALENLVRQALQANDDGASPLPSHFDTPQRIGRFNIVATLGSGGGGVVYQGFDPILDRVVAIKVLHSYLAESDDFRQRFLQEGRILSELSHAGIVAIHEVGYDRERPFLVFEYCSGGSLSAWLESHPQQLSPPLCARILLTLAFALQHAHSRGILHRDVNPKNVLLVPFSESIPTEFPFVVKLSDFGLGTWLDDQKPAVRTQTGAVLGTLFYMAPEQSKAEKRVWQPTLDVYALGVILYELLTRRRPFSGDTPVETLNLIQNQDPIRPRKLRSEIPRDLETICLKCLDKSPGRRFQSAGDLVQDLERFLAGDPIRSRQASRVARLFRWTRKRRFQVASLVAILLLIVALGIGGVFLKREMGKATAVVLESKQQSHDLDRKLTESEKLRNEVERQRVEDVRTQQEKQRRLEYNLQIATIARSANRRSFLSIQKLREFIPKSPEEPDLRGFEWYFLMQQYGGDCVTMNRHEGSTNPIEAMHVSDTGDSVFLAQRSLLSEWQVHPKQEYRTLFHAQHTIRDFAINRERNRLALSVCQSPAVHVFELSSLQELPSHLETRPDMRWCNQIQFQPATHRLFSICSATSEFHSPCRIYDEEADRQSGLVIAVADKGRIFDFAFDVTTNQMIHTANNQVHILPQGRFPAQILDVAEAEQGLLTSIAVSENGQTMAAATDRRDILLCQKSPSNLWKLDGHLPVTNLRTKLLPEHHSQHRIPVRFNRTGDRLYSTGENDLRLWDLHKRKEACSIANLPGGAIRYLELLNQGRTAVWANDYDLGLWNPIEDLPGIAGHSTEAWTVSFSHDNQLLATGGDDHTVRIWNLATGRMFQELRGHQATVTRAVFSPQGDYLASGSLDGTIRIWDAKTWKLIRILQDDPDCSIRSLAWFPDSERIAVTVSPSVPDRPHCIQVWDVKRGSILNRFGESTRRIHSIYVTADQNRIVVAGDNRLFQVWDANTCTLNKSWIEDDKPTSSILINQERWLATGIGTGSIRLRDLETGSIIRDLKGHVQPVLSISMSPDGRVLASGSIDQTVRLWDIETGHCILVFQEQESQINSVAFSPDGNILASAAHDGSVKLRYGPRFVPLPDQWQEKSSTLECNAIPNHE